MRKIGYRILAAALVCVGISANGQQPPNLAAQKSTDERSLDVTMQFIKEKLDGQETLQYVPTGHDIEHMAAVTMIRSDNYFFTK